MLSYSEKVKKIYSLKETPWYFGVFLNQARHNLYIVLNDLTVRLGGSPIQDDSQLASCKAITVLYQDNPTFKPDPVLQQKAIEYYEKHIPFLFAMHYKHASEKQATSEQTPIKPSERTKSNLSASITGYYTILTHLIDVLNGLRNFYSHYNMKENFSVDKQAFYWLNDVYDVNVRLVKSRFSFSQDKYDHLIRLTKDRGEKKPKPNPKFHYNFFDAANHSLSQHGLSFLICMFLSKREGFFFLKKLKGFKDGRDDKSRATLEVFTVNTIVIPKERMESDRSSVATFLDLANELARCPKELYDVLSDKDKEAFEIGKIEEEDSNEGEQSNLEPLVKRIRSKNRFVYFAQRYLDISKSFRHLRFGVELGHLQYGMYTKEIAGEIAIRQFTKKLIGYGRLDEFAPVNRPGPFKKLFITQNEKLEKQMTPYILETYPQYQIEGNNIPLFNVGNTDVPIWPEIDLVETSDKPYPIKLVKQSIKRPLAVLSTAELPALLFYQLVVGENYCAEKVILDHLSNIKRFLNDVSSRNILPASGDRIAKPSPDVINARSNEIYNSRFSSFSAVVRRYGLRPSDIPDRLVNGLIGIENDPRNELIVKREMRLHQMIMDAVDKVTGMERREKTESKPGKKSFRKIKVGKLAEILTQDFILMQPSVVDTTGVPIPSSKANSTAYRLLQSTLAYFGEFKDRILEILRACRLVESQNPHPFLDEMKLADYSGIVEFYKDYFRLKVMYLNKCLEERAFEKYYFLKVKNSDNEISDLAKLYLNQESTSYCPINLPRGIFHRALLAYFGNCNNELMRSFVHEFSEKSNLVHLINQYFSLVEKDRSQYFYQLPRCYAAFKKEITNSSEKLLALSLSERVTGLPTLKGKINELKLKLPIIQEQAAEDIRRIKKELLQVRSFGDLTKYFSKNSFLHSYSELDLSKARRVPSQKYFDFFANAIELSVRNISNAIRQYDLYLHNEKYLRFVEVQDKVLFMSLKPMLETLVFKDSTCNNQVLLLDKIKLEAVGAAINDDKELMNILDLTLPEGFGPHKDYFSVDNKGLLSRSSIGMAVIADNFLKIRNYGNFIRVMRDRRLNNLCLYFEQDLAKSIWLQRSRLINELDAYDRFRLEVIEKVYEFERSFFNSLSDDADRKKLYHVDREGNQIHHHGNYLLLFLDRNSGLLTTLELDTLKQIRNGFLHNQFAVVSNEILNIGISIEESKRINESYVPSAAGSTEGYGIAKKIRDWAIEKYESMIATF
jgi:hypothetical protein